MKTDLQDGMLKGISPLSFAAVLAAITHCSSQVPLLLQTCTETHVKEEKHWGKKATFDVGVQCRLKEK